MPRKSISVLRLTIRYIEEIQAAMVQLWGASFNRVGVLDYCIEQLVRKHKAGEVSFPIIRHKMKAFRGSDKVVVNVSEDSARKLRKLGMEYRKYGITDGFVLSVIVYTVAAEFRSALLRIG